MGASTVSSRVRWRQEIEASLHIQRLVPGEEVVASTDELVMRCVLRIFNELSTFGIFSRESGNVVLVQFHAISKCSAVRMKCLITDVAGACPK